MRALAPRLEIRPEPRINLELVLRDFGFAADEIVMKRFDFGLSDLHEAFVSLSRKPTHEILGLRKVNLRKNFAFSFVGLAGQAEDFFGVAIVRNTPDRNFTRFERPVDAHADILMVGVAVLAQNAVRENLGRSFLSQALRQRLDIEANVETIREIPHFKVFDFQLFAGVEEIIAPDIALAVGIAVRHHDHFPRTAPVNLQKSATEDCVVVGMGDNQ